jgi:hypothetical protein
VYAGIIENVVGFAVSLVAIYIITCVCGVALIRNIGRKRGGAKDCKCRCRLWAIISGVLIIGIIALTLNCFINTSILNLSVSNTSVKEETDNPHYNIIIDDE